MSTTPINKDLVIIGAGPSGYSAAFRAADLGRQVSLVDTREVLGGVCLNEGCIPSKALLHASETLQIAHHSASYGIHFGKATIDLPLLRKHIDSVTCTLTNGLSLIAKRRQVQYTSGTATLIDSNTLSIKGKSDTQTWRFTQLIIATGSSAIRLPNWPTDERIWDAAQALQISELPKHLVIVGGGIIGLEMATIYRNLGCQVSVVELSKQLAGSCDPQAAKLLHDTLITRGISVYTSTEVSELRCLKRGIDVYIRGAAEQRLKASHVLQCVGRRANTAFLGLHNAGIVLDENSHLTVAQNGQTSVEHIYAVGDVTGGPMLAHRAVHQAKIAAESCCGMSSIDHGALVPSVAYTQPEVAWVGLTAEDAKMAGIECKATTFPWAANGRTIAQGSSTGFSKILYDVQTQRIIGATLVGDNAGELIAEITLSIEMGANLQDLAHTIHPHPTRSESVAMAAELALGLCTDL